MAKKFRLDITHKIVTELFHICNEYRHHCPLSFMPLLMTFPVTEGHKVSKTQNLLVNFHAQLLADEY